MTKSLGAYDDDDRKATSIDPEAVGIWAFQNKHPQPIEGPEAILDEYRKRGTLMDAVFPDLTSRPPFAQYTDARGYPFVWGHILERHAQHYVVWDFCFDPLLHRYHEAGLGLADLQQAMWTVLANHPDLTTAEDIVAILNVEDGLIVPGSVISAFSIVLHFAHEPNLRAWVSRSFIPNHIPELVAAAVRHVEASGG